MNTYFYKYLVIVALILSLGWMTSCGKEEEESAEPVLEITAPVIKKIDISSGQVVTNGNETEFSVTMSKRNGGRAELTATGKDNQQRVVITGDYDTKAGAYVFNLSTLEAAQEYSLIMIVYDANGDVVMESNEKVIVMPDTSDSAAIDSEGTSDGTRSN